MGRNGKSKLVWIHFQMNLLWLLLFVQPTALYETGCIRREDEFVKEPEDTELNEGANGVLNCQVKYWGTCFWYKDGHPIYASNRYSFNINNYQVNCSIRITNSTVLWDDGKWTCIIAREGKECARSRQVHYTVLVKPKRPSISVTSGNLTNGSQIEPRDPIISPPTIECQSKDGNPVAKHRFSAFLFTQNNRHQIHNYKIGTKGIDQTSISVLRLSHFDETWFGQKIYCTSEHTLGNQSVYITFVKRSTVASPYTSLENSTSYLAMGAILLFLIGGGFGALCLHFYRKIKANKHTKSGKESDCERTETQMNRANENEENASSLEPVEYMNLAFPNQDKKTLNKQPAENESCYAELDFTPLNNVKKNTNGQL